MTLMLLFFSEVNTSLLQRLRDNDSTLTNLKVTTIYNSTPIITTRPASIALFCTVAFPLHLIYGADH
jgi:hypothetical protein